MKKIITSIILAVLLSAPMLRAQGTGMTFIKTDWEYGKQYYYFIDANDVMQRIIAFNDTLPGMFEWWPAIQQWVPMAMNREQVFELELDGRQPIVIGNAMTATTTDSGMIAAWYGNTGIDTLFTSIFAWDDTLGGALQYRRIGTANDSTKLIRKGAPFHPDTVGGKRIYGVIDLTFPDTTNGDINVGLVEPTSFSASRTSDGIFVRKVNASNKVMLWQVRNNAIDSLTIISNCAVNTRYRIGLYVNGANRTLAYVNGTYIGALDQYCPWDEDLTLGFLFKNVTAGAGKTGLIFYARFRQLIN